MTTTAEAIEPIIWRDDRLHLLDQRQLPHLQEWIDYDHPDKVAEAIKLVITSYSIHYTKLYEVCQRVYIIFKEYCAAF